MPIDLTATFQPVRIAVLTVSDTRGLAEDRSGDTLVARLGDAGHVLADREIVKDDVALIIAVLHRWIDDESVDCVITTGALALPAATSRPKRSNGSRRR